MASKDLGKLSVSLELATAGFSQGAKQAQTELSSLGNQLKSLGSLAAGAVGIGALGAGFKSAISAANEFNAGLADIASLMPGNSEQVRQFGVAIQDLSIASGKSTTDLTAGMYQVVSAYGGGADAVERLRIVTEASQAGLSTTTESLNLLSVTTKAYGDTSVAAMNKASDLAFKTVQLGQTTFPELAASLQNVASTANKVGVSQEELFASFSATTGVIGNASMVSTKLRSALDSLSNPTGEMINLFEKLRVKSGEALIKQEGLQGAMQAIVKAASDAGTPLAKYIGAVEGQAFAISVAGAQSQKFKDDLKGMGEAAGTTKLALDEQTKGINSFGHSLTLLQNAASVAMVAIGNSIMEAFGPTSQGFITATTQGIEQLTRLLNGSMGRDFIAQEFISSADKLNERLQSLNERSKQLKDLIAGDGWFTNKGNAQAELGKTEAQLVKIRKDIDLNSSAMKTWYNGVTGAVDATEKLADANKVVAKETSKAGEHVEKLSGDAKKAAEAIDKLKDAYAKTLNDISQNKVGDAIKIAVDKNDFRGISALGEKLYQTTRDEVIAGLDDSIKSSKQAIAIAENMARAISNDKVKAALAEVEQNLLQGIEKEKAKRLEVIEKIAKKQDEIDKAQAESREKSVEAWAGLMEDAISGTRFDFEEQFKKAGVSIASEFLASFGDPATLLKDSIKNAFSVDVNLLKESAISFGKSLSSEIQAAFANADIGTLGAGVAGAIVGQQQISGAMSVSNGGKLSIGEQAALALPTFGASFAYNPIKDFFEGSKDAEAEARDRIESYLENTLHTNIETSGLIREGWAEDFALVAGEGQNTFRSLGIAIGDFYGQSSEIGEQMGYVLAENLNGNINEARILVQSLGLDAETMGNTFLDAAKNSEMSWHDFEIAMQGVDDLTQEGIVGVGNLRGAYDLLRGTGTGALVSIRNFAVEATEAGAESVASLGAVMKQLGFTQEETDRMISVLRGRGIESMEQLRTASERSLGGIVADLESAGMQWSDYADAIGVATDEITDLEERISGIHERTVDINVRINYDDGGDGGGGKVKAAARGGIFDYISGRSSGILDNARGFATGGIVSRPTYFGHSGGIGLAGEAGREAIIPLGDGNSITFRGLGGDTINVNVDARGAAPGVDAMVVRAIQNMGLMAVEKSVATVVQLHKRGAL